MIHLSRAASLLVLVAALAPPAFAQPAGEAAAPRAGAPAAGRPGLAGYRPFDDAKPLPWPQANAAVRAIGGWRAYAREAQQAPPAAVAAPASAPRQPEAADPHAGHAH